MIAVFDNKISWDTLPYGAFVCLFVFNLSMKKIIKAIIGRLWHFAKSRRGKWRFPSSTPPSNVVPLYELPVRNNKGRGADCFVPSFSWCCRIFCRLRFCCGVGIVSVLSIFCITTQCTLSCDSTSLQHQESIPYDSVSAGRNQGYQFNLQYGSFPVPDWIGATSDLETFYTVKALVSNCLGNPYKRFTTRANHLREFSQGVSINNG